MNFISTSTNKVSTTGMQSIPVVTGSDFRVTDGVNLGDPLLEAAELLLDDHYQITHGGRLKALDIVPVDPNTDETEGSPEYLIAPTSLLGTPGNAVYLDSVITLMAPDGKTVEALIMVEVIGKTGEFAGTYLLPITDLVPSTPYRLVGVDPQSARKFFALVACVSFTRGTAITMADGTQKPIEQLHPGDRVLTRDNGSQEVRWIGEITRRAEGEFAPILIRKHTLNNENDLLVSPGHRLFFWQRVDELNLGRSEVLIQARHLVDGDKIRISEGGFIDYFQLLFDDHQIIYAEGIATESLLLDPHTKPALPEELCRRISDKPENHDPASLRSYEDGVAEIASKTDIAACLRRASSPR